MDNFRAQIREATGEISHDRQVLPGVVVIARSGSDNVKIQEAYGYTGLEKNSPRIDFDSTFWIASCTKLATAIAVLQVVERGLVTFEEDITRVIPEWKNIEILTGFDKASGEPVLKPSKNMMTLRHLLTHSSGMSYDLFSPKAQAYRSATKTPIGGNGPSLVERTLIPLMYEPGEGIYRHMNSESLRRANDEGFDYSPSIDWAGAVVERVSGEESLEVYMKKHIWGPLGMSSTTFRPQDHAAIRDHMCPTFKREGDDELRVSTGHRYPSVYDGGGGGMFSTPTEYTKLLMAVLKRDPVLLNNDSFEKMFSPQIDDTQYLEKYLSRLLPNFKAMNLGGLPATTKVSWSFGGLLSLEDVEGKRRKGSLSWSGLPNLYWWIDPASDICGHFATQVMPQGDVHAHNMYTSFEAAVYHDLAKQGKPQL